MKPSTPHLLERLRAHYEERTYQLENANVGWELIREYKAYERALADAIHTLMGTKP